jgi:hypothetical protein
LVSFTKVSSNAKGQALGSVGILLEQSKAKHPMYEEQADIGGIHAPATFCLDEMEMGLGRHSQDWVYSCLYRRTGWYEVADTCHGNCETRS